MDTSTRKPKKQQHKQPLGHANDADVPAFASEGLRRRRKDTSGREYDEVDDRITIPLAASHRIGVTMSTSSSSSSSKSRSSATSAPRTSEAILQSGLSKYRSLSGKATAPVATTTSSSTTTTTTTTTAAASTTTSPTVIVPGASLKVPSESASDARGLQQPARVRSQSHHRSHHAHRAAPPEPSPYDHAMRLVEQKQHAAAIPYFTQALAQLSSSGFNSASGGTGQQSALRIYYHRGVCLLAAQKFDKAIEDFTRVITMTPKHAQLFAKRARAYAQLPHYAAALSDYNEAIELLSSTASTSAVFADAPSSRADLRSLFVARARVYVALNDSHRALDDLARAESTDGHRDADVYYTRAHVLMARGDDRLALQDLDRFLELQDDELAHHDIVVSDNCSPSTSRTEALERMQDVRFERAKLLLALAAMQERAFETDADVLAIEQGDARASGAGRSGYQSPEAIALVLRAVADYSVLLDVASASLSVPEVLLKRSDALGRIGRFEDALSDLDRAQALAPHDFEVRLARARLYQHQGDLSRAIDEITAVLQLNGFFVDALFFRAALYEQTGAFAKAQRDYTSIIEAHYDLRGESCSEDTGAATEQTPLLSKAAGSSSSSSKSSSKSAAAPPKPHKILSQYSKRALLLRARVHVALERFDDAIADYERIQQSFPNELEPQLELPDVIAKKDAWVERTRLEALEALLAREDEEQRDAKRAPASKKKKKKKKSKKSKSKSRPTPADAGYVLLPDDDDNDDERTSDKVESVENESVENVLDTVENATESSPDPAPLEAAVVTTSADASAAAAVDTATPSAPTTPAGRKARSARPSPTASVTRDEACESMWEQVDDAIDATEAVRAVPAASSQAHASVSPLSTPTPAVAAADADATGPQPPTAARASHRYPTDDDTDGGSASDERLGESGDDSASDASRRAHTATPSAPPSATAPSGVREVLVDKKYLLKRERQLKNVRMDLLAACDARDRVAIDEVLERAERKQMTESLEDEIRRAKDVLARLDSDAGSSTDGDAHGESGDALGTGTTAPESGEATVGETREDDDPAPDASPAAAPSLAAATDPTESDGAEAPLAAAPTSGSSPSVAAPLHKHHRAHRQASPTASPRDGDVPAAATASKPPSLVIRPIAYGHALQLAEQSQHQFAQTQRLLVEKDAEIAALRQLLAQSQRDAAIERFDSCDSGDLARRVSALRAQFPLKELRDACSRIDTLVHWLGPTDDADVTRRKVLAFVHHVLEAANFALGAPILVFPTGSFPMKTYLPTADLDVCLLLPQELEPTWHFPVLHALCLAGSAASSSTSGGVGATGAVATDTGAPSALSGSPNGKGAGATAASGLSGYATNTVRNVNFINADVRVIKCTIDNISVDFTANRVGALGALLLLDAMAARVGRDHLLKKSIILIKAWCIHESSAYTAAPHGSPAQPQTTGAAAHGPSGQSVLGASYGAFSTYAINTVVMGLFNQHGTKIAHPLHALFLFLDRMAEFPWHDAALTLHGPVPLSVLASGASVVSTQAMLFKKKAQQQTSGSRKSDSGDVYSAKLTLDDVEHIRQRTQDHFGGFSTAQATGANGFKAKPAFQLRAVNIVDPLDEKNNLARSVSAEWFPAMKRAFRMGRNRLALLLTSPKTAPAGGVSRIDELDDFFATSWRTYGRGDGWRPDLLVHPRQVWHGKAPSGPAIGGSSGGSGLSSGDGQTDDLRWQSILPELVPMTVNPYQQPQPQGAMYYAPQYPYHHPHAHHASSPAHGSGSGGVPVGLGLSEPLPYQTHQSHQRRSFDSGSSSSSTKTSPLKSVASLRHRSASSMASAVYSNGTKVVRSYDSPPTATSPGRQR